MNAGILSKPKTIQGFSLHIRALKILANVNISPNGKKDTEQNTYYNQYNRQIQYRNQINWLAQNHFQLSGFTV